VVLGLVEVDGWVIRDVSKSKGDGRPIWIKSA